MTPDLATPSARQGNSAFATSLALLLIRLVLGWIFIYHGSQKLFGCFTPDGKPVVTLLAQGLAANPLPLFAPLVWAYIAAIGEFVGGLTVFLGLLARLGSLPILVTMWVAIATVHGKNGFGMQTGGYEYNLALIAMAGAILIAGPGLVSADAYIFRRGFWARGPQPLQEPGKRETVPSKT